MPRDDRELEQMTGIKPADHGFVGRDYIRQLEKKILGPNWGKKKPPRA
jgi:hypothetical protein